MGKSTILSSFSVKKTLVLAASLLLLPLGAIPAKAAALHYIVPGDSLYRIAASNGITVKELKQANGLRGDLIRSGDHLSIPASSPVSSISVKRHGGNPGDIDLLARLVTAEAGAEPFKGKVAVAAVILNRTEDLKFPATIARNIFKPHEFESVSNGLIWEEPIDDAYKAAHDALRGWDPTNGAKYFFNPAKAPGHSWVWTRTIVDRIGNHVFAV